MGFSSASHRLAGDSSGALNDGFASLFSCIPGDQSTFLVVSKFGKINKINRYGGGSGGDKSININTNNNSNSISTTATNNNNNEISSANHEYLDRKVSFSTNDDYATIFTPREGIEGEVTSKSVTYRAEVSCMSVASFVFNRVVATATATATATTAAFDSKESESTSSRQSDVEGQTLVLVGRKDGSVDLFNLSYEFPLYTWDLSSLDESSGHIGGSGGKKEKESDSSCTLRETIAVKWCGSSNSSSIFFAIDSFGTLYLFDLSISFDKPLVIDRNITDFRKYTKTSTFKKQFKFHKSNSSVLYSGRHILSNLIDVSCESNVESQTAFVTASDPVSLSSKSNKIDAAAKIQPASSVKTRQLNREIFPLTAGKHEKAAALKLLAFKQLLDYHTGSSTHSTSQVLFQKGSNNGKK